MKELWNTWPGLFAFDVVEIFDLDFILRLSDNDDRGLLANAWAALLWTTIGYGRRRIPGADQHQTLGKGVVLDTLGLSLVGP